MRLSELFPQSIDEIFSITIAASLREEVATDWDPLLFSSTDTVCFHAYKQCIMIFLSSTFLLITCLYGYQKCRLKIVCSWIFLLHGNICNNMTFSPKCRSHTGSRTTLCFDLQICKGCCCNDNFFLTKMCLQHGFPWRNTIQKWLWELKSAFISFSFFFFLLFSFLLKCWKIDGVETVQGVVFNIWAFMW